MKTDRLAAWFIALSLAVAVLGAPLAGCGGGPDPTAVAGDGASTEEDRPAEADQPDVDEQIDEILASADNSKEGALAAFAAVMGPVPGYEDQPAVEPLEGEWVLGDRVIDLVLEHAEELSNKEREAVLDTIEGQDTAGGSHGRSAGTGAAPATDLARLQGWADEFTTTLGAAFGHRLSTGVTVRTIRARVGDAWATTALTRRLLNSDADGNLAIGSTCLIQIGPRLAGADDGTMRSTMAHEVFHCFQDDVFSDSRSTPEWFHEGLAAWVGLTYGADVPFFGNWWRTYLQAPDWSLESASYDAVGMFSTLQTSGVDVAAFVTSAFASADPGGPALLGQLTSLVSDDALGRLGPSPARLPSWGTRWVAAGPGIGGTDAAREPVPVTVGGSTTVSPAANGNVLRRLSFDQGGVVVTVEGTAYGAWRWGESGEDLTGPLSRRYCGSEPCLCPDGTPVPGGPYAQIPGGELTVGLASLAQRASSLDFTVTPIEELCDQPPAQTPEDMYATLSGPGGGTWTPADGDAYCTAEHVAGGWILSIGPPTGRSIQISSDHPPVEGPQQGAHVTWSDGPGIFLSDQGMVLKFDPGLGSGSFSGTAIDATVTNGPYPAMSGTFACGDGGTPPTGAAPWTGG